MGDVVYEHDERWPANTWINLWVETYNRPPVMPQEMRPTLEKLGLDVYNPEEGVFSVFGESLVSYDEGQGIGKSLVFVRDPRGLMTKSRLIMALIPASWTPATMGPFEPSVSYWLGMSDTLQTNQDTITALWNTQQGSADAWSFAKFFGTVLKVSAVGAVGILLFSLYARAMPEPRLPRRRAYR
jgi:hypothetical protein